MSSSDIPAFRTRVFLAGASMRPSAIRARWPHARLVSIARADGVIAMGLGLGGYELGPELWGIVVETGEVQRGTMLPLWLPDGSSITAMSPGGPEEFGTVADALAQARYWELPASYRERLEAVAATL